MNMFPKLPEKLEFEGKISRTGTGTVVGTGIFWLYMCIGTGTYTGTGIGTGTYSVFQFSSEKQDIGKENMCFALSET